MGELFPRQIHGTSSSFPPRVPHIPSPQEATSAGTFSPSHQSLALAAWMGWKSEWYQGKAALEH